MTSFSDYFSAVAAKYAAYRPHYPVALVELLREVTRGDTVWDIGCGSGQLTIALANKFASVIATDPAEAQLANAPPHPHVEYRVATAEASGLPDASIDLAVAAQAAHWFDWPRFVAEAGRVVKPGGVIALVGYGNSEVAGDAGREITAFVEGIAGPFWPHGRVHINNGYRDLVLPWPAIDPPEIEMAIDWTREEFLGYASSWSATNRLLAARGPGDFEAWCARLAAVWPDGERRRVRWPLLLKLGRRPS
ncbi:MAG: methyltransferase domain-containing protein [Deltaproteobacteria bacterium]|nr:methyltransferase domain-containing protein [Deltaproteobacteria bacterium]